MRTKKFPAQLYPVVFVKSIIWGLLWTRKVIDYVTQIQSPPRSHPGFPFQLQLSPQPIRNAMLQTLAFLASSHVLRPPQLHVFAPALLADDALLPAWPSCLVHFLSLRLGILFFQGTFPYYFPPTQRQKCYSSQCFQNLLLMTLLLPINTLYHNYWCVSVYSQPGNSLISISQHSTVPGIQSVSRGIAERIHSLKKTVVNKRYYSKEKKLQLVYLKSPNIFYSFVVVVTLFCLFEGAVCSMWKVKPTCV